MSDVFGIGGAVQGASTIAAAAIQADAASHAADLQYQAAQEANAQQKQVYDETVTRNKPYYDTGTSALTQLGNSYGLGAGGNGAIDPNAGFYQSPDYQFRMAQGIKGVDAGAAARGMLDSGATRKAEIGYAGNLASGEFNTYANRLQALAGIGQASANNQAAAGQGYANAYGQNVTNAASAAGNASFAGGSAWSNALGGLAGQFQSSYGGAPSGGYSPGVSSSGGGWGLFGNGGITGQGTGPEFGWT